MQTGRYGRLLTLSATLHFGASQRHDLVFMHDGTHLIDAIRFVTDEELRFVRRVGVMNSNRSSVFLHAETTDSGVPVVIEVGAERRYMQFELALSCESGTIRVGNGVFEWSRADDSPFYSGYRSLRSQRRNRPEPTEYFRGMVNEAVRLVHDPAARSASRAIDGYRAVQIIQRVKRRWARW
jgi:predicted dehydrogenase